MQMMRSGLITFLLIFAACTVFAGTLDSIGVTKINNKLHVRYLVSPGETIYRISTKFGVPVTDLMEINPELENGLKVGQVINIPYNPELAEKAAPKDDNLIVHKVQPGETFYSLSKKYNTTIDDLMKMNNVQLKAGQEIVVGHKDQKSNSTATTPVASNVVEPNSSKPTPVETTKTTPTNTVNTNTNTTPVVVATEVKQEPKPVEVKTTVSSENTKPVVASTPTTASTEMYPFDASRKQVLVIPFDPYLYFSDADDEIAARSDIPRTKVRQIIRKRLNAMLEAPGYETIHLLGGKAKDSLSDMNKIYSMVTYNYQVAVTSPYYKEEAPVVKETPKLSNKEKLEKLKNKITNPDESTSKYNVPTDHGNYFGVVIKNPDFYTYFNAKYSVDYYIFVSQFEVKTNYEHCLDRSAQNYERTFTTHFSIFDNTGKQIAGNKFKTHYASNSNMIYQIVADNIEKIANRIIAEMPPPNQ